MQETREPTLSERRQLSILFADLVGSTAFAANLDPEEYKDLLSTFHSMATAVVEGMGGRVAQYLGDGVLAYFGFPAAREDDAEQAVRAGLQLHHAASEMSFGGAALTIRVGIATGVVIVGDIVRLGIGGDEHLIAGDTPNLAVRLQALSTKGKIVVADATRQLIGGLFTCRDLGKLEFKGFPAAIQAWEVVGENSIENRFGALRDGGAPLTGRVVERKLLMDLWQSATGGNGQVIVLRGEAGIGKSRLVAALRDFVSGSQSVHDEQVAATVIEIQGLPHHANSPLYPVAAFVRRMAGLSTGQREDAMRQRLAEILAPLACPKPRETLAALSDLLGIERDAAWPALPVTARERHFAMQDAILRMVEALAALRPILLVVEDAQWLDATTRSLLDLLCEWCPGARVAILVTERIDEQGSARSRSAGLGQKQWLQRQHVSIVDLGPLTPDEARALVSAISPRPLPDLLIEAIVRRTDGVPLFTEELARSVLGHPMQQDCREAEPWEIPPTLLGVLTARLDQAGPAKDIAQLASIVGRSFTVRQVEAMRQGNTEEIEERLEQLREARLVDAVGNSAEPMYRFRHALIQDAAYDTLLRRRRRELHRTFAAWLETNRLSQAEATDEIIATHYSRANLLQEAISARRRGAEEAFARGAQADAANLLGDALLDIARLPEGRARDLLELDVAMQRAGALATAYSYAMPELGTLYERCRALSGRLNDAASMSAAKFGLMFHSLILGSLDRAESYAAEMLVDVDRAHPQLQAYAHMAAGMVTAQQSRYAEACVHLRKCVDITQSCNLDWTSSQIIPDLWVFSRIYLAYMLAFRGEVEDAIIMMDQMQKACRLREDDSRHAYSHVLSLLFTGKMYLLLKDAPAVEHVSSDLIRIARKHRYPYYMALGEMMKQWAIVEQGDNETADGAMSTLSAELTRSSRNSDVIGLQIFHLRLAELHLRYGDKERALQSLGHTLETATSSYKVWDSESKRIMSQIMCLPPNDDLTSAELLCRDAITIARNQGSATLELRAAVDCARILEKQGRWTDARALLEPYADASAPRTHDGVRLLSALGSIVAVLEGGRSVSA